METKDTSWRESEEIRERLFGKKIQDHLRRNIGFLCVHAVTSKLDDFQRLRVGQQSGVSFSVDAGNHAVLFTPENESRARNPVQSILQRSIVEVRRFEADA